MKEEFEYSVHEYTYILNENTLKHKSHETNFVQNTIRTSVKEEPDYTKVFLVLNGSENSEEAYVFENGKMLIVYSCDAFKAVEIIACLPFNVGSHNYLIRELTRVTYTTFISRHNESENLYPF